MQAFEKFLFGCVSYRLDLAAEMQGLASHRVVKVHRDLILGNLCNEPPYYLAFVVEHRKHPAFNKEFVLDLAIDCKGLDRNVNLVGLFIYSVALFRGEHELEAFARFLAFDLLFKARKQHACSVNV